MKINSKITLALLALGLVSSASADNVVYLTGSTAFRGVVYNSLHDNSGGAGAVFDAGTVTQATRGNANPAGCNYMLFHGKIGGTPTYIDCVWSGSEAGIASASDVTLQNTDRNGNPIALAGSPAQWLLADGSVSMTDSSANPTSGELEATSHGSDLAQADTSQAVSLTPYVAGTSTALKDYGTEGVVTFTWAKNYNTSPNPAWSRLTNITMAQANVQLGYPQVAAFFTGNPDDTNRVYTIGRNKGSGTRANTLSYSGYGTTTSVQQFSIGYGVQPGEAQTSDLLLQSEGNNGYESGGGVAKALGIDGSCSQTDPFTGTTGWIAIGYLGVGDALTAPLTTSNFLTESGVMESDGAIEEGQYAFWGHEHLFGKFGINGYQDQVGGLIFNAVQAQLANSGAGSNPAAHSSGIALTYMHCDKATDVSYPVRN
jgi:hypothetical protein